MTGGWVVDVLSPAQRRALDEELAVFLPGTAEQRQAFIEAADEALFFYRDDSESWVDPDIRVARIQALADAGRAFSDAVARLDPVSRELVENTQWIMMGHPATHPRFKAIEEAAKRALFAAEAADRWLAHRSKRDGGRPVGGPFPALVEALAKHYAAVFGVRPSAARNGTFLRAAGAVLRMAGIDKELGEKQVAGILDRAPPGGAAPRRGRKPRA